MNSRIEKVFVTKEPKRTNLTRQYLWQGVNSSVLQTMPVQEHTTQPQENPSSIESYTQRVYGYYDETLKTST